MSTPERKRRVERYEEAARESAIVQQEEQAPLANGVLATNTGVRLACTMAAMIGLFAIFLCWVEKESRVIRRFAVQSAALTAVHVLTGVLALILPAAMGGIPYLGMIVTLLCLLIYIAVLILLVVVRVRLMERAWKGLRFELPASMERMLMRYY